jgi:hypothetical protein
MHYEWCFQVGSGNALELFADQASQANATHTISSTVTSIVDVGWIAGEKRGSNPLLGECTMAKDRLVVREITPGRAGASFCEPLKAA